jgi:hypothetical protein
MFISIIQHLDVYHLCAFNFCCAVNVNLCSHKMNIAACGWITCLQKSREEWTVHSYWRFLLIREKIITRIPNEWEWGHLAISSLMAASHFQSLWDNGSFARLHLGLWNKMVQKLIWSYL